MPNIATALKQEICRLARKEIRVQTAATRRAATQHRREIAHLRRLLQQQEKKIKSLLARQHKTTTVVADDEGLPEGVRYSARSVRAQRRRLGLSAEQFAKLLGVSMQTVYSWEQGRARPRQTQLASLVAARALGRREAQQRLAQLHT
jgi:DNA-binding transcriptional regulator YiaG